MATKPKKEPAIPLHEMLLALDRRDRGWYSRLSDEQKKAFSPWLTMRYASSVQDNPVLEEHYLLHTNAFCNRNFSAISVKEHAELHWLTMQTAGVGRKMLHPFIKPPKGIKKNKIAKWISSVWPMMKDDEIELLLSINSVEDFADLAEQLGMEPKEIEDIFDV